MISDALGRNFALGVTLDPDLSRALSLRFGRSVRLPLFQPASRFGQLFGNFPKKDGGAFFAFGRQFFFDKLPQFRQFLFHPVNHFVNFVHVQTPLSQFNCKLSSCAIPVL